MPPGPKSKDHVILRFGAFELDLKSKELREDGVRRRIQRQPFKVLALLASRPGEALTRQELQAHVWGDDVNVDYEHGLNYCIREARRALGDEADNPRYIETIPKVGYRFLADVERTGADGRDDSARPVLRGLRSKPLNWMLRVAGAALLIAVFMALIPLSRHESVDSSERKRMAVLPFRDLGAQSFEPFVTAGLAEDLITRLAHADPESLRLIAHTSSMSYLDTQKSAEEIADDLKVDYLIEGSLRRLGGQGPVVVQARLIEGPSGVALWSERFKTAWDDPVSGIEHVSRRIASTVAQRLHPGRPVRPSGTCEAAGAELAVSREAREECFKGRYFARRNRFIKSIEHFENSLVGHPGYSASLGGLALAYAQAPFYRSKLGRQESWRRAEETARRALALDPHHAEARLALGVVLFYRDWNWEAAEEAFARALADAHPAETSVRLWYACFLSAAGRHREAIHEIEKANRYDMRSSLVNGDYAWHLYHAGHYEKALLQAGKALSLRPDDPWSRRCLIYAAITLGRYSQAVEALTPLVNASRLPQAEKIRKALLDREPREATLAYLEWQSWLYAKRPILPYRQAVRLALLDRPEEMFAALEKAIERKKLGALFTRYEPAFQGYQSDPRFQRLLARIYP